MEKGLLITCDCKIQLYFTFPALNNVLYFGYKWFDFPTFFRKQIKVQVQFNSPKVQRNRTACVSWHRLFSTSVLWHRFFSTSVALIVFSLPVLSQQRYQEVKHIHDTNAFHIHIF